MTTRDPDPQGFAPGPDTLLPFRRALGCYGTGVTVVTALTATGPLAMTANSFASVSLSPPLVLWCPAQASPRHDRLVTAPRFSIHVMAADQQDLARHFARHGDQFDGLDWTPGTDGTPHLAGCLARFDCTRHAVHPGGDHSIVLGQVNWVETRPGDGLMFKRGQYGAFLERD